MFRFCTFVLALLFTFSTAAWAGDPLAIVIDDPKENNFEAVYFPPGTTFEVVDTDNQPVAPNTEETGYQQYQGDLLLLRVFPAYRPETADLFRLENKRLRIYTTDEAARDAGVAYDHPTPIKIPEQEVKVFEDGEQITDENGRYIGAVKADTQLSRSTRFPGKYNLKLTFTNGLVFIYTDGATSATLNGETVKVTGNYIIRTQQGTAKFSFDPNDGEVWYVFDPSEK